jgi:subtilisin family serine protease
MMSATPIDPLAVDPTEQALVQTTTATNTAALTGLDVAKAEFGLTGQGQTVAVIDTGIAYTHTALGGGYGDGYKVVGGYDFTNDSNNPYDFGPYGSHGTHVSGIIGSTDATNPGVAPGVDLVALRVFDNNGNSTFAWVDEALKWVDQHRNDYANPITTVNLSLGTMYNGMTVPDWATLEQDFAKLQADGIFISVAAGNAFQTYGTTGLSYPAVSPYVVPVASEDANGQLSSFSQRAANVIVAPGSNIRSTVPDYVGNLNGKDDDFATYSGTSMASPYVAGASVLIRQAMEFSGQTNVTETQIYDVMFNTANIVHDAATNADYHELNLERALESVMPKDEYGSTAATASSLGSMQSSLSLTGVINTLADKDYFSFTATQSGTLTLTVAARDGMVPQWNLNGAASSGNTLTFNVVAGQKYTFGIGTTGAIGHYAITGSLQPTMTAYGAVDFLDASHLNVAGEQWATFTASRTGTLTLESFFNSAQGNLTLEIYDAHHNLITRATGANGERLDLSVRAGDTYYVCLVGTNSDAELRITNLVSQTGSVVSVFGTAGNDTFNYQAGAKAQFTINGVSYSFNATKVTFDGGAGSDTAKYVLTANKETVTVRPGSVDIVGIGFEAHGTNVELVTVAGNGGADVATLYGSAGADVLTAKPNDVALAGAGYSEEVIGFVTTTAYGNGGADQAYFSDSATKDIFNARQTLVSMQGVGYLNQATGFATVVATSTGGGDVANLYDSTGNDSLVARPTQSTLSGTSFSFQANSFAQVFAYSTGGKDTAYFYDSAGVDVFTLSQSLASMQGTGYLNQATGFANINAYASNTTDRAQIYDSIGNNLVTAKKGQVTVVNPYVNAALYSFGRVTATANANGRNQAQVDALDFIFEKVGSWV